MAQLEIRQVCKGYDHPVLDRIDFSVDEGEFFVVVGPSGIGKTTLLRCIAGLETLDGGQVVIGGRDVTGIKPYERNVAMTFESYALYPHLSVFENIASPLRARRSDAATVKQRVTEVAELLRIAELLDRKPHEISGGQKQRTALGRTLAAQPDVFLLDEPISHLDAKIRHQLRRQFHALEELRRVATVYVTHDYTEALSLGDRIGIMGDGGLVQIGSARDLFERPSTLFVARHLGQPSINEIACDLVSEDGRLMAAARGADGLRFPVAERHRHALEASNQGAITLGIRPQHIAALKSGAGNGAESGAGNGGTFVTPASVEVFEALGATGVLIADLGGVSVSALTATDADFEVDQAIRLALDSDGFLYFGGPALGNLHS